MNRKQKTLRADSCPVFLPVEQSMQETKNASGAGTLTGEVLALCLTVVGALFCALTSFHIQVNAIGYFLFCAGAAVIVCLLYRLPKARLWLPLGSAVLVGILGYRFRELLMGGGVQLLSAVRQSVSAETAGELAEAGTFIRADHAVELVLLLGIFLFTVVMGLGIVRRAHILLVLPMSALLVGPGLFLGLIPAVWTVTCYLSGLLAVLFFNLIHLCKRNRMKKRQILSGGNMQSSAALPLSLAAVALVCAGVLLSNLLLQAVGYERPEKFDIWREMAQDGTFEDLIFTSGGGVHGGKLDVGNIRYRNEPALRVVVPQLTSTLYLRGYVGSNFTGEAWTALTQEQLEAYEQLMEPYRAQGIANMQSNSVRVYAAMQIEPLGASKRYAYLPYASLENSGFTLFGDSYATPNRDDISVVFDSDSGTALSGISGYQDFYYSNQEQLWKLWQEYGRFAQETYVQLPERETPVPEEITQLMESISGLDDLSKSLAIRQFLWDHASYTLTPGTLPYGKDFVDYFLFENHKGYCTHFAAAGVMLLRMAGIPARYVEGYLVTPEDYAQGNVWAQSTLDAPYTLGGQEMQATFQQESREVEILDTNAHAWVEYCDNLGQWNVIDMTPGYSAQETENAPAATVSSEADSVESAAESDIPAESSESQSTESSELNYDPYEQYGNYTTNQKNPSSGASANNPVLWVIGLIGGLLILTGLTLVLRRKIRLAQRRRAWRKMSSDGMRALSSYLCQLLRQEGFEAQAFLHWEEARRWEEQSRFLKEGELTHAVELIDEACFSGRAVSAASRESVQRVAEGYAKQIADACSFWQELSLRYISNLF